MDNYNNNQMTSDQMFGQYGKQQFNMDGVVEISPFPAGDFLCKITSVEMGMSPKNEPQLVFKINNENHSYTEFCTIDPNSTTAFKLKRIISGFGVDTTGANITPLLIAKVLTNREAKVTFVVKEKMTKDRLTGKLSGTGKQITELQRVTALGPKEHITSLVQAPQQNRQEQPQQPMQQPQQGVNQSNFEQNQLSDDMFQQTQSNQNDNNGFGEFPF